MTETPRPESRPDPAHPRPMDQSLRGAAGRPDGRAQDTVGGTMTAPENVFEIEIATTAERLWKAITDPEQTRKYWHGALSISDWRGGSPRAKEAPPGGGVPHRA